MVEVTNPTTTMNIDAYAVQIADEIWVVHAFQKKSTQGIRTPTREVDARRHPRRIARFWRVYRMNLGGIFSPNFPARFLPLSTSTLDVASSRSSSL